MKQVRIIRTETDPDDGTFGVLKVDGESLFVTLEPYSRDNAVSISSIPANEYICKRYSSKKYPNTFEVTNVHGRSKILFHAGNIDDHTEGCILVGQYFGKLRGEQRAVMNSGRSFRRLLQLLHGEDQFRLTITEAY